MASVRQELEKEIGRSLATELLAQRDQLDQQVRDLLSAIEAHRAGASPTSTPQKFSLDGEVYAAADKVRKERGE